MRTARRLAVALALCLASRTSLSSDAARQIVVGLAPAGGTAAASRLGARLERLGAARARTLADGLPPLAAAIAARARPFDIDPARVWLLEAPDSAGARALAAALAHDPDVAWVEPSLAREPARAGLAPRLYAGFPDDPLYRDTRQWGLRNAGPAGVYGGIAGADIQAAAAWAVSVGSPTLRLAIADTGIDPDHPDLACVLPDGSPRIEPGLNVTLEPGGAVTDSFGHGTPVAGVMAARSGEGPHFDSLGVAGVCGGDGRANPGCRIVPIKIAPGHSGFATSFDIARAILYATAVGARAVNLSFAGAGESAVERAALYDAVTRGCVVVAAAGNKGDATPQYPAAYAADGLCLQVGASDPFDRRAAFSSYGPGLDVVAPGVDVWTTFMTYPSAAGARYDGYVAAGGTSFAAPFVTGTAGLLAALRPELTDTDFQRLIRESAHDLAPPGPDPETGWGRLDAGAALAAVPPDCGLWHDEVAGGRLTPIREDTLRVSDPGPGTLTALRGSHRAEVVEVEAAVALPDSFLGVPRVWPRVGGTYTVRAGFRLPYFAPWCEVVEPPGAEAPGRRFTLRGYLYRVRDDELPAGLTDPWVPVPPDQARFGFTVLGRVDRPPALDVLAPAPGTTASAGETLAVRWEARDPDTVSAVEVWLEAPGTPALRLARLPGGSSGASIALPCPAASGGAALRVVALDEHGPQRDRSERTVPVVLAPGDCPAAAPRALLLARPNPFHARVRLSGPAGGIVTVVDLAGRVVALLALDPASGEALWDGRDTRGRPAPAGLYLARCGTEGRASRCKLVKLDGRP